VVERRTPSVCWPAGSGIAIAAVDSYDDSDPSNRAYSVGEFFKGGASMSRRAVGLSLLNISGVLVILGALYDLLVPSVPLNHLAYLGAVDEQLDPRYAEPFVCPS
jgi:hypothetical protein